MLRKEYRLLLLMMLFAFIVPHIFAQEQKSTAGTGKKPVVIYAEDSFVDLWLVDSYSIYMYSLTGELLRSMDNGKLFSSTEEGAGLYSTLMAELREVYGAIVATPVVYGNMIIFGDKNGSIYALDKDTLQPIWVKKYFSEKPIIGSLVVAEGKLYVPGKDSFLYCINLNNGEVIWSFKAKHAITMSPAVVGGRVYFGAHDGYFYALDANNGNLVWRKYFGTPFHSSPLVVSNTIYVGGRDGKMYALNKDNGEVKWTYQTGGWIYSSPIVYDKYIYFGSFDFTLYCLEAETGKYVWSFRTGGPIYSSPFYYDERIYFASYDNYVYALDYISGFLVWKFKTSFELRSSPVVYRDKLFIGGMDTDFYCLDSETGELLWKVSSPGNLITTSPIIILPDGNVVYPSTSGMRNILPQQYK